MYGVYDFMLHYERKSRNSSVVHWLDVRAAIDWLRRFSTLAVVSFPPSTLFAAVRRQLIGRYDGVLADLEKQLKLRRLAHRSAEQKAQKLWEQLAAAERIVKAHAQPIDKLTQRVGGA